MRSWKREVTSSSSSHARRQRGAEVSMRGANACYEATHHNFFPASLNAIRSWKHEVTSRLSSSARRQRGHFKVQRLRAEVSLATACDETTHQNLFLPLACDQVLEARSDIESVITRTASTRSRGIIAWRLRATKPLTTTSPLLPCLFECDQVMEA